jgi:hypothetical protein
MKKLQLILFTSLTGFIALLMMSASRMAEAPARQEAKGSANQLDYAKLLNGDDAFYQDYNDFLKGGRKWKYLTENAILTFGKISIFNIVFKTDQGKRQKLDFTDFWGWREDGKVYRNGDFVQGKITKIPFGVSQVTSDYIMYHPYNPQNVSIQPDEWFSDDLTSPIMPLDVYFKRHSKETYNRIEAFGNTCFATLGQGRKKNILSPSALNECLRGAPDMLLIYTSDNVRGNSSKWSYKK